MAAGDVILKQNGRRNYAKIHPHLIAVIRWCVSCVWSTAAVVLHRLAVAPLPQLTAKKQKISRPPGKEHLHPEPKVECVVLHKPAVHSLDVVFVHGLYGSLCNTWRQGDWRSKYKMEPKRVPLKLSEPSLPLDCDKTKKNHKVSYNTKKDGRYYKNHKNRRKSIEDEDLRKLTNEIVLAGNYFASLYDRIEIVDNYATQTSIKDLFHIEFNSNDQNFNVNFCADEESGGDKNKVNKDNQEIDENERHLNGDRVRVNRNKNDLNEINNNKYSNSEELCDCEKGEGRMCEVGCGCVCEKCYSPCWPKDWIKMDYPEARVVSINYTSDPHLWRPLWIKPNKRLRLHERAEQMIEQLIALGIGTKPIIWVGHSKGGLFIKQIYCEGYEEYLKYNPANSSNLDVSLNISDNIGNAEFKNNLETNCDIRNNKTNFVKEESDEIAKIKVDNNDGHMDCQKINCDNKNKKFNVEMMEYVPNANSNEASSAENTGKYTITKSDLWRNSVGFMFYSVPHRGSPLADIKTPITARSVELLEISKDCDLVLSLHGRWLKAIKDSRPKVCSLVETNRTLMSILWLRIVSADSADAGIGALFGVELDHREICKPSSRHCALYTELKELIRDALDKTKS